jgi:hypothetical protein
MKKITSLFFLNAALTCLLLAGCSKSPDNAGASKNADAAPQGPVELKLKWNVGKQYNEQMTMTQNMEMAVPGNPDPMHQQMELKQNYALSVLKERAEGGVVLELKFVSQKMSSKMDGKEMMSFDSTSSPSSDGANPAAATFRKIIGAHVRFLVDANGKIDKVEGYDDFINQISGSAAPEAQLMVKSMFNEDTLKQFGARGQGLPDKPVKVGDTWPNHIEVANGPMGTLKMNMNYKFAGWEQHDGKNCVLLTYTGDMVIKAATNNPAMNMSIENGAIEGKSWFDPALGTTVDGAADQSMTLKMNMQGKTTSSIMKQKITMKLVGISDIATY